MTTTSNGGDLGLGTALNLGSGVDSEMIQLLPTLSGDPQRGPPK